MVMEASPSPQSVGREFVRQYYTLLNKAPAHLHRFYNNFSSFVHGGLDAPNRETLPVVGQKQIHHRIQQLNFRDCHAKISQVDAQATLGNGVVVQVTGELSNGGAPMRRFTQTFVLAAQSPKKYYVHNDIFRYQDIVFSDEEGEGSGRSEGEDEEVVGSSGYYPAGAFPPPPFPAPPAAPPAALLSPAAPAPAPPTLEPHLNGHPQIEDTRHLVAAMQQTGLSSNALCDGEPDRVEVEPEYEPERELEPEPECEPEPPLAAVSPPAQAVPPEPKTYANLLKSGSGARTSPPAYVPAAASSAAAPYVGAPYASVPYASAPPASAPPAGAAPAVYAAPQEQRGRPPRAAHTSTGGADTRESRRYSDSQQLFLGNLPHSATEEELRVLFARFGPVADLRVHSKGAAHPNYGFITYETAQAAAECLSKQPLYYPADGGEGTERVKLNVEEKKARGREPPRRRPLSSQRSFPRQPYRR
ncbi:ras GTPase-activating protein-binding protein 2 isoform X2 [Leptidea sinapis]|uniref:ras GTPase-activating protein-binding protein 2 isoform X2 n=1 Tax=Leptidea sinapis TaxID=189913 RepID=UPI0021C44668|nr:ras GTPase-activating protein-binding protein 2 isoform X2 [Leptidea sinapis]